MANWSKNSLPTRYTQTGVRRNGILTPRPKLRGRLYSPAKTVTQGSPLKPMIFCLWPVTEGKVSALLMPGTLEYGSLPRT